LLRSEQKERRRILSRKGKFKKVLVGKTFGIFNRKRTTASPFGEAKKDEGGKSRKRGFKNVLVFTPGRVKNGLGWKTIGRLVAACGSKKRETDASLRGG